VPIPWISGWTLWNLIFSSYLPIPLEDDEHWKKKNMLINDIEPKIQRVTETCFDLKMECNMSDERKWEYTHAKMSFS
jgi:hypothetical protein